MRVVHVITGLSQGGAESALYRLLAALPEPRDHTVVSLTDEGVFGERIIDLGIPVIVLGLKRGGTPSLISVVNLARVLHRLKADIVQTWMYHSDLMGGVAARFVGLPVCWGIHHSNLSQENNKATTLRVVKINAVLSRWIPCRIISCSKRGIDAHKAIGYSGGFINIPNGLDVTRFFPRPMARDSLRKRFGISQDSILIGHLGRPDPQKDHSNLLKAFDRVAAYRSDVFLLLAGKELVHGSEYLEGLLAHTNTKKYANRIFALGQRDDVPELMAALDVYVSSSIGEAFPTVLVEAMACGTPCVVTDVGDSAEIVGPTGWVVKPGDSVALSNGILEALDESAVAHTQRGNLARQRIVDRYGIDKMVRAYNDVWSNVLGH